MESIHTPKKPRAARAGVLVAFLLLALLLALPGVWYARYHDQLAASAAGSVRYGAAPATRPSGAITLPPPTPGITRTVQIQHTGGQVITMVHDGFLTISARTTDPHPPSNALDVLGQSLCDRYNAWDSARGDARQPRSIFMGAGGILKAPMMMQIHYPPTTSLVRPSRASLPAPSPPTAHVPGRRAPGSSPRPAAHILAGP